jgi:Leucine-rich repeat (LRR) protein
LYYFGIPPFEFQSIQWADTITAEKPQGIGCYRNFFSKNLPLEFGAPNLERLILSFNYITGQVPGSICKSRNMKFFDLSHNLFKGELPHCSDMSNLSFLLVSNNSCYGIFPSWLQSFSSLVFLDLSWNKFNGPLPRFGELTYFTPKP